MAHSLFRPVLLASLVLAALSLATTQTADAQECAPNTQCGYPASQMDLFYNYYVGAGPCPYGVPARLYLSPRPTPAWVGHTYVTYQPLMPHEFLYPHHRTYTRLRADGSATRTRVVWY